MVFRSRVGFSFTIFFPSFVLLNTECVWHIFDFELMFVCFCIRFGQISLLYTDNSLEDDGMRLLFVCSSAIVCHKPGASHSVSRSSMEATQFYWVAIRIQSSHRHQENKNKTKINKICAMCACAMCLSLSWSLCDSEWQNNIVEMESFYASYVCLWNRIHYTYGREQWTVNTEDKALHSEYRMEAHILAGRRRLAQIETEPRSLLRAYCLEHRFAYICS